MNSQYYHIFGHFLQNLREKLVEQKGEEEEDEFMDASDVLIEEVEEVEEEEQEDGGGGKIESDEVKNIRKKIMRWVTTRISDSPISKGESIK